MIKTMKIVRAPLRVSLFGGGTDLDPFCSQYGSTIISFAINKYMHVTWNPRPTGGCHLSYSQVEELDTLKNAQHTLVREAARRFGIEEPCTLTIVSDVPKGTGLGSSSALAVCLAKLIDPGEHLDGCYAMASEMEQAVSNAGYQDYLPATFSKFRVYHIIRAGMLREIQNVPSALWDIVNIYGLLLYTGNSRPADSVLGSWKKSTKELMQIKCLADEVAENLDTLTVEQLGRYLDQTWQFKREISDVTSPVLNRQYAQAVMAGALGGKLCGAGAGGCWFFLVPPEKRQRVIERLGLREIPFQVEGEGVRAWDL